MEHILTSKFTYRNIDSMDAIAMECTLESPLEALLASKNRWGKSAVLWWVILDCFRYKSRSSRYLILLFDFIRRHFMLIPIYTATHCSLQNYGSMQCFTMLASFWKCKSLLALLRFALTDFEEMRSLVFRILYMNSCAY